MGSLLLSKGGGEGLWLLQLGVLHFGTLELHFHYFERLLFLDVFLSLEELSLLESLTFTLRGIFFITTELTTR